MVVCVAAVLFLVGLLCALHVVTERENQTPALIQHVETVNPEISQALEALIIELSDSRFNLLCQRSPQYHSHSRRLTLFLVQDAPRLFHRTQGQLQCFLVARRLSLQMDAAIDYPRLNQRPLTIR